MSLKHQVRFFGGGGTVFMVYGILRLSENLPFAVFVLLFAGISYGMGWLLDGTSPGPRDNEE